MLYHNGFLVLQDVCQIHVLLIMTGNFVLFLSVAVLCTLMRVMCACHRKADALVPVSEGDRVHGQLAAQEERPDTVKNVRAMLMHKLGGVVVNNTDNLLISSFVGVVSAGIYSQLFPDHRLGKTGAGSGIFRALRRVSGILECDGVKGESAEAYLNCSFLLDSGCTGLLQSVCLNF